MHRFIYFVILSSTILIGLGSDVDQAEYLGDDYGSFDGDDTTTTVLTTSTTIVAAIVNDNLVVQQIDENVTDSTIENTTDSIVINQTEIISFLNEVNID